MNLLDIVTPSPNYFHGKSIVAANDNLNFNFRV